MSVGPRLCGDSLRVFHVSASTSAMQSPADETAARFASACVLSAKGAQLLDTSRLVAVGFRARTSPACMADVLITSASLAISFLDGSELIKGTPQDADAWNRCS